jgi:hypothetical protein
LVTQYITYFNMWGALSRTLSSLSTYDQLDSQSWVDNEDNVLESAPHILLLEKYLTLFFVFAKYFNEAHLHEATLNLCEFFPACQYQAVFE